jgi:hypothetical protein
MLLWILVRIFGATGWNENQESVCAIVPSDEIGLIQSQGPKEEEVSRQYGLTARQPMTKALLSNHCMERWLENRPEQQIHYTK